jgi:hypothetical protein
LVPDAAVMNDVKSSDAISGDAGEAPVMKAMITKTP